jgi:hypothetical protein
MARTVVGSPANPKDQKNLRRRKESAGADYRRKIHWTVDPPQKGSKRAKHSYHVLV